MNICFFASYNGSSARAITDACFEGELRAAPTLLITNNADAAALEWAEAKGLKSFIVNKQTYDDPKAREEAMIEQLQKHKITFGVLSGYMRPVPPAVIHFLDRRLVNIHPALLPDFGGKGMYGAHVHRAVKESGAAQTGITIHQVSPVYDDGRILAQKTLKLNGKESAEDIEEMVKAVEPDFYIETLKKIQKGQIILE